MFSGAICAFAAAAMAFQGDARVAILFGFGALALYAVGLFGIVKAKKRG